MTYEWGKSDRQTSLVALYKESRPRQLTALLEQLDSVIIEDRVPLSVLVKMEVEGLFSNDRGIRPKRGFRWLPSLLKHVVFARRSTIKVFKHPEAKQGRRILICTAANRENARTTFEKMMQFGGAEYYLTDPRIPEDVEVREKHIFEGAHPLDLNIAARILKLKGVSLALRLDILKAFAIQNRAFRTWKRFFAAKTFDLAVFDQDNHGVNSPIVAACRANGIKTATIIHGCSWPMDNFVPFCADYIFLWGQFHAEQFADYIGLDNTYVVGNSSMRTPTVNGKMRSETKNIGLATNAWSPSLRRKILQTFLEGTSAQRNRVIRQHPREAQSLGRDITDGSNIRLAKGGPVHQFLNEIDVLCARESTLALEALGYCIPIVIIDCDNGRDLLGGFLLNKFAGCPIIQEGRELDNELMRLQKDAIYYAGRIDKQTAFLRQLCTYFEDTAAEQLSLAISNICGHASDGGGAGVNLEKVQGDDLDKSSQGVT